MKRIVFALASTALAVAVGCNSAEKKEERSQLDSVAAATGVAPDTLAEYNAWETEADRRLAYNDSVAAAYREQAMKDKKNWAENEKKVKELEEKNKAMRQKKADYREQKMKSKWQTFKDEFNRDMDALGQSFSDLGRDNVKDRKDISDGKKTSPQEKPDKK